MRISKTLVWLSMAVLFLGAAGVSALLFRAQTSKVAHLNLRDALQDFLANSPVHLYPSSRSIAVLGKEGVPAATYVDKPDGTQSAIFYRADGITLDSVRDYYPSMDGVGARRLSDRRSYQSDGKTLSSEARFRQIDGSLQYDGRVLDSGDYLAVTYFEDGVTPETEVVTSATKLDAHQQPMVLSSKKWQIEDHRLRESDVLDTNTYMRQITLFDSDGIPTLSKKDSESGVVGNTETAYFPGSVKVAMESSTNRSSTEATFFREDGTVNFKQSLTTYGVAVNFFDASGQRKMFQQYWFTDDVNVKPAGTPRLWQISELNAAGETTREITFSKGVVSRQIFYNLQLKGNLYKVVTLDYDDDGKLRLSAVTSADPNAVVPDTESLNLASISTLVDEKEKLPPDLSYELPVPPPSRHDLQ